MKRLLFLTFVASLCPLCADANPLTDIATLEGAAPNWEMDNRRCRVLAKYNGVTAYITNDSGQLQLDVLWKNEEQTVTKQLSDYEEASLYFQIDGGKHISLEPLRAETGVLYAFRMGQIEKLAPVIAKGKVLYVGDVTGPIRAFGLTGSKTAMQFLKTCQLFWERWHNKRR